ncbi:SprT-like_family protein [Hexamita inflata]|uniref:SprT-like family protein n=1 Tax=Hexamita inflata TaxID=28002 RepID=A0AA86QU60_9EUKA|nr:SprT-like family protein [Hexamita inflata]
MQISDQALFKSYNLYEMFDYYNQIVFNNELRPAKLYWAQKLEQAAGICTYVGTRTGYSTQPITIRLSIQLLGFRPEYDVANVLVHEMIHALLFQRMVFEQNSHGPVWMAQAIRANDYFGLKITQYHYGISAEKVKQLDADRQKRVQESFLGNGTVLSQEEVEAVLDVVDVDDLEIVDIDEDDEVVDVDSIVSLD